MNVLKCAVFTKFIYIAVYKQYCHTYFPIEKEIVCLGPQLHVIPDEHEVLYIGPQYRRNVSFQHLRDIRGDGRCCCWIRSSALFHSRLCIWHTNLKAYLRSLFNYYDRRFQ